MTELELRMTEDFDWAQKARDVKQNPAHYGQFVVVHNKRVLAVGRDREALVEKAAKEIKTPRQHLVVVIAANPDIWEIPH